MDKPIRLKAESAEDLTIVSAMLQDAVAMVGDIAWLPRSRRFAMVLNRYRWEGDNKGGARKRQEGERVRSGLRFENVLDAQFRNLPVGKEDHVLDLLAVRFESDGDIGGTVTLDFAGYASLKLTVEAVEAFLEDITGPWPARTRPGHELGGEG